MTTEENDIPPTDPTPSAVPTGRNKRGGDLVPPELKRGEKDIEKEKEAARRKRKEAGKKRTATFVPGELLLGELEQHEQKFEPLRYFWTGSYAACPVFSPDVVGVSFPKITAEIVRRSDGKNRHEQRNGGFVHISFGQWERLCEAMRRTVVRFKKGASEPEKEEPGTGENIGDLHRRPKPGFLITIPTEEDLEAMAKQGREIRRYNFEPGDRPLAEFVYMIPCPENRPERGMFLPDSLAKTGLIWPE